MHSLNSESSQVERPKENYLKVVWQLAWPAVTLNGIQLLNGLLDTFYIGRLPKASLNAHGASLNVIFFFFSLAMVVSVASTALVSRAYGAGNHVELKEANRQCLSVSYVMGLAMMIACMLAAQFVPKLLIPNDPVAAEIMQKFLFVDALCFPAIAVVQALAGSMRGIGDTRSPMIISGLQVVIHMVLNGFFIFPSQTAMIGGQRVVFPGMGLGLPGGAVALTIGAYISAFVYLIWAKRTLLGGNSGLFLPEKQWVTRIFRIVAPASLQAILRVLSFTAFTYILQKGSSEDALGALRIGIAIESVMFMPAFGLSMAASALVGQSLGMGEPKRAEVLGWIAAHQAAIVIFVLSLPLFIFAPTVAGFLTNWDKPEIAKFASDFIRILVATEILFGYAMVLIGAMQGAGDTKRTMWITVISLWGARVPLAYVLSISLSMGATGCWIAMTVTQALQGLMCMLAWKAGAWKQVKV